MTTRVYAPTTVAGLSALLATHTLPVTLAFAVTDRLRALLAQPAEGPAIEEELAEAAVVAAADACLALLSADPRSPRRRVVVAADVGASPNTDAAAHPAAVDCPAGIPMAAIASVLADDPQDPRVVAAVTAAVAAHEGGTDATFEAALDALDDHALAWFDVSEIADLAEHR